MLELVVAPCDFISTSGPDSRQVTSKPWTHVYPVHIRRNLSRLRDTGHFLATPHTLLRSENLDGTASSVILEQSQPSSHLEVAGGCEGVHGLLSHELAGMQVNFLG